MNQSAVLARRITWSSSKQSFLTAWLLADRHLVDDCLRGYAYFRWADDRIDLSLSNQAGRQEFIQRQKSLIDRLYRGERPADLSPEEAMLADLIAHDRGFNNGLQSFIRHFMAVLEFDAGRKDRLITDDELSRYTEMLATAVMDGIQYFIGNCYAYPRPEARCQAVIGAHITHMLRDLLEDIPAGYVNIPVEALEKYGIDVRNVDGERLRDWARERVLLARACFKSGKQYIRSLSVLRCKLAGYWYCARFERVLDAIEQDGYILKPEHGRQHSFSAWLAMARLGIEVIWDHAIRQRWHGIPTLPSGNVSSQGISKPSMQSWSK